LDRTFLILLIGKVNPGVLFNLTVLFGDFAGFSLPLHKNVCSGKDVRAGPFRPPTCQFWTQNKKYQRTKGLLMNYANLAAACIALFFCALFAGCTSPTQAEIKPVDTTVTTTVPETTATIMAVTTTLESVVPLPANLYVDLQLTKDRPTSKIHLLYNGGTGEIYVQSVRMKVTRSDGTVTDELMDGGIQPKKLDELIVQGTKTGDRCEVWVTTSGKVYKIIDENLYAIQ
jgi:hypothetical protein